MNGPDGDLDMDGRSNFEEFQAGTSINNRDTDDDGLTDGEEQTAGTDPFLEDSDSDGLSDFVELRSNVPATNALLADSDGDGFADRIEVERVSAASAIDATLTPTFPAITWSVERLLGPLQFSTEGNLLFAENLNGTARDVNGITFAATPSTTPVNSSDNFITLFTNESRTDTYDEEIPELRDLIETFWWDSDVTKSQVAIANLTPGHTYVVQFVKVDDRDTTEITGRYAFVDDFGGNNEDANIGPDNTIFGGPFNADLLFTGTFVADSTVQGFSTRQFNADDTEAGSQMAFLQVRDLTIPIVVEDLRVTTNLVEVDFSDLDVTKSYRLVRSLTLEDAFPDVVDGPRNPTDVTDTFSDSTPPASGKAFYRLEEMPTAP